MTTKNEYHLKIMKMANIEFEDINDEDILTWDYFDQGFGMRSWFHLYHPDGYLKDIQCGNPIAIEERKFSRPARKKSALLMAADQSIIDERKAKIQRQKERNEKKATKKTQILMVANPGNETIPVKKKQKRNLSISERARRAERMRLVAQNYWASKRKNTSNATS